MEEELKDTLLSSLDELENQFNNNELAYLALTKKVESPIRDKWAFYLHTKLSDQHIVAREWSNKTCRKKIDLAILSDHETPEALIELKAMYAFDALKNDVNKFVRKMEEDKEKAEEYYAKDETSIYTVLLATHPKSTVPEKFTKYEIKYNHRINKSLNKYGSSKKVKKRAFDEVANKLSDRKVVAHGSLDGGEAFGIETEVLYWVVKAEEK